MSRERDALFLKIIMWLAVIAFLVSIYLIENHYADAGGLCDLTETLSCSTVNTSIYSEIFNIPVAFLGALWAAFTVWLAHRAKKNPDFFLALWGWSLLGLVSILYFIAAEFILGAICPFCTVVHVIVLIILALSAKLYFGLKKKPVWEDIKKKVGGAMMLLLILTIAAFVVFNFTLAPTEDYTEFAQCLTDQGITMYGSYLCSHCITQKNAFGDAVEFIDYVECHPDGPNPQTELCTEKDISGTPIWLWESDGEELSRLPGAQSLDTLSEWSGCELP
tara:strand:+ start:6976 stop:7806 length:831 start_codon:yes stop_codon:yes gene_type:complete